jgi:hypothetical protein
MQANIRSLERNVLKLIRHPDTTQEQLAEVRTTYVAMWQSYMDVKATLKEKFPGPRWGFNEPWNMPE